MPIKTKNCARCGVEFLGVNGTQKFCKPCQIPAKNERNSQRLSKLWHSSQEYRDQKKEQQRQYYAASYKKAKVKRDSVKRFVDAIKLTAGCADCGYNERAVALDFDHIDRNTKTRVVAHYKTIKRAIEEIEKCEVVCAIHHRIRTEDRGEHGYYARKN